MKLLKKIINFVIHPKENYTNWYFLKYHVFKTLYKINKKNYLPKLIKFNRNFAPSSDMFNWSLYNHYYRGEIKKTSKHHTIKLKLNDYIFKDGSLQKNKNEIKPLHPNHQLLYETIIQLNPQSIFEIGCGNGMHLANLQLLLPNAILHGIDRSKEQIDFLRESFPEIKADIKIADATIDFPSNWLGNVDLSFTQAVIMHIHTKESHLTALANLFNVSKKYVILMERWKNHNFMNDIKKMKDEKRIQWEKIYFYYKILEETGKPHLMICSKTSLTYTELMDYSLMLRK